MAIEWWQSAFRLVPFKRQFHHAMLSATGHEISWNNEDWLSQSGTVSIQLSYMLACSFLTFKAIHGQKANKCIYQIVGTIPSWEKIYLQECKMVPKLCHHIDQTSCSCNLLMGACTEAMLACFSSHDRSVHQDLLPWIYVQAFMVPRGYDWLFLTRHREVDVVLNEKSILI